MSQEWNTLITSGAYIGEEMQAEFGRIPPAFLPIGAAFLIQHQLREMKGRENIWLSLPNDYDLTISQERILKDNKVQLFRSEPRKSLGLSIFQAILEIGPDKKLEILHGDTLALNLTIPSTDCVSVSTITEQYQWGLVESHNGLVQKIEDAERSDTIASNAKILSGYFVISQPWRFLKCLVARDFNFTQALHLYASDINVSVSNNTVMLDCGHLKTYYDSRRNLAAARHFNSIKIEDGIVRKQSKDKRKIDAEANWLRSTPENLQPYTVRLIENPHLLRKSGEYNTLYSSYPTLAELYLARTPPVVWGKILESCVDYLEKAASHTNPEKQSEFEWLVIGKLRDRITQYPEFLPKPNEQLTINGYNIGTLENIVEQLELIIANAPSRPACVMHGDFCFSNIIYDLRNDRIQLIDPRGLVRNETTIYGDLRYDIAKLGHSILGRYDQILGESIVSAGSDNSFVMSIPPDPLRERLEKDFLSAEALNQAFNSSDVMATIVSLFLSMVPLHAEAPQRQRALFANGLRLYVRFFGCALNTK
jgi:hypothetical protein